MSNNRNRKHNNRPPQDQGSPIDAIRAFRFKHKGQTYELPPAAAANEKMTGGDLIDAAMEGEIGQVKFFAKMLAAADPEPEALAAIRDMPLERFGHVMQDWMKRSGAHPGKSGPSST